MSTARRTSPDTCGRWLLALALAIAVAAPATLAAGPADAEAADDVEMVFDFEIADPAGEPANPWLTLLGRLHVLLVHFPIAWLWLAAGVTVVGIRRPEAVGEWDRWLLMLTALAMLPALATGWINHELVAAASGQAELAERHERLAFITFGLVVAALVARTLAHRRGSRRLRHAALALVVMAALLVGATGHLGGSMVFGVDYLRVW